MLDFCSSMRQAHISPSLFVGALQLAHLLACDNTCSTMHLSSSHQCGSKG